MITFSLSSTAAAAAADDVTDNRCQFYLPIKRRHCANSPLPNSKFCGNHDPSSKSRRVPCPIDPSHFVSVEKLDWHVKRCPLKKQVESLEAKVYYSKGMNGGVGGDVGAEEKRRRVYGMSVGEFEGIVWRIRRLRDAIEVELKESFVENDECKNWMINLQVERQLPYQEKHVVQQVSIIGNMEAFGVVKKPEKLSFSSDCEETTKTNGLPGEEDKSPAVVEFGAGRGYLTHMLADCYDMKKIFLIERRSYKLKADRSLRQKQGINLERLRIDSKTFNPVAKKLEDLDLRGIESLKGHQYLAIGKHLCGPATDLAIRCCLPEQQYADKRNPSSSCHLQGLAIATCCHHLCQWKHYINTNFMSKMGITPEDFHAITWFSSWAVEGDHSSEDISDVPDQRLHLTTCTTKQTDSEDRGVEVAMRNMTAAERATLGFICKEIIDTGRLLWLRDHGFDAQIVKYVPSSISPENHLLVAKCKISTVD